MTGASIPEGRGKAGCMWQRVCMRTAGPGMGLVCVFVIAGMQTGGAREVVAPFNNLPHTHTYGLTVPSIAPPPYRMQRVAGIPWRRLLSERSVWALIVCHFCHNWGTFILLTWMPSYYNQVGVCVCWGGGGGETKRKGMGRMGFFMGAVPSGCTQCSHIASASSYRSRRMPVVPAEHLRRPPPSLPPPSLLT